MGFHTHDRHAHFMCQNNMNKAQKSNMVTYSMSPENCYSGSHRTVTEKASFQMQLDTIPESCSEHPKRCPLYFSHTIIRRNPSTSLSNMPNGRKHIKSAVCKHTMREERVNSCTKKKKKAIETPSSEGLFHISKRTTQFLPKMNKLVSGRAVFSSFFILHFKKEKKNIAVQFKHPQLEFLNLLFEKSQV